MKRVIPLIVPLLLALGFSSVTSAQYISPGKSLTLFSRTTYWHADGRVSRREEAQYFYADGSFRLIHRPTDSHPVDLFYLPGRGRFMVDHANEKLKKDPRPNSGRECGVRSAEHFMSSPNFVRKDEAAGMTAYVHRFKDPESGEVLRDAWYAPELGCSALKVVFYQKGKIIRVTEPLLLVCGEPDRELLRLPDLPVVEDDRF